MSCGFCFSLGLSCRGQAGMGSGVRGCWFYEEEKPMNITKLYKMDRQTLSEALEGLSEELLKELGRVWKADIEGCENTEELQAVIWHRRNEMHARDRLVHRLGHYKKLIALDAPDMLFAPECNLVARSVLEVQPKDLIETIEQFPALYREWEETHKENMEQAQAAIEEEFAKGD